MISQVMISGKLEDVKIIENRARSIIVLMPNGDTIYRKRSRGIYFRDIKTTLKKERTWYDILRLRIIYIVRKIFEKGKQRLVKK